MGNMATFHPNPDEEREPWIERSALEGSGFRVWHLVLFCFAALIGCVILICCCVKIRIPRTKQEIEADYKRKLLVKKFRDRIRLIQHSELDEMDLKRAMEIIQEDYKTEVKNIDELNYGCDITNNLRAEPQQPSKLDKIMLLMRVNRMRRQQQQQPENEC